MEEKTKELEEKQYTAAAGGGAVTVTVSGKKEVVSVKISPEAVDPRMMWKCWKDMTWRLPMRPSIRWKRRPVPIMAELTGGLGGLGGLSF